MVKRSRKRNKDLPKDQIAHNLIDPANFRSLGLAVIIQAMDDLSANCTTYRRSAKRFLQNPTPWPEIANLKMGSLNRRVKEVLALQEPLAKCSRLTKNAAGDLLCVECKRITEKATVA